MVNKGNILKILVCMLAIFITLFAMEMFNDIFYKIDMSNISKKNLLFYKQDSTTIVNGINLFIKSISDGEYDKAFEMVESTNRKSMFNDSVSEFKSKVIKLEGNYLNVKYNTIFSNEYDEYTDEEVICILEDEKAENNFSIRCNVRNYKNGKSTRLIVLNIK